MFGAWLVASVVCALPLTSVKKARFRRRTICLYQSEQEMSILEEHQVPPEPIPGDDPTPDQSPTPDEDPVPDHNPVAKADVSEPVERKSRD